MDTAKIRKLKDRIDGASVISFDVFDTLLFRKVNEPETIFELTGKQFGIHGFRKLRLSCQKEADKRICARSQYQHAKIDEIYEVLAEHTELGVDWDEVKNYEIQMERDALTANREMLDIFQYARNAGKRVIAVCDTYLPTSFVMEVLEANGFAGIGGIYSFADERTAASVNELLLIAAKREEISSENMLHIGFLEKGGNEDGDYADFADRSGVKTFAYQSEADLSKIENAASSDIDRGLYRILYDEERGFWHHLGVEVGGPLYLALFRWFSEKVKNTEQKIFFLSEGGYYLYRIFKNLGYENVEYLSVSQKTLLMASVIELDAETQELLAVYNVEYHSQEELLAQCAQEREALQEYFAKTGFLSEDTTVFDCGWEGAAQRLIERCKAAIHCECRQMFYYAGIRNTPKSRKQLHGLHYDTFLFDFYKNYELQAGIRQAEILYRLFFSATDVNENKREFSGGLDKDNNYLENGCGCYEKKDVLDGILDYVKMGLPFAVKYDTDASPESAIGHLERLIHFPTEEEITKIKNLYHLSTHEWTSAEVERADHELQVWNWDNRVTGTGYHLEDGQNIRNYHRWIHYQDKHPGKKKVLSYRPGFSVVIPVYNTVTEQLRECFDSVLGQTYENFELVLVDDNSSWKNVVPVLREYEANAKVRVIYRTENGNISVATNDGIAASDGEFIVFMDCDDVLAPDALYELAAKLNENPQLDFIYTDEDKITEDGKIRHMPFFKPDWSPDLFLCMNYTNHLSAYRASIVKKTGGLRTAYNGSQDYDFMLRFMERSDHTRVGHIPKILYHWRERKESVAYAISSKNYASEAAKWEKEDYIRRNALPAHLEYIPGISQYRMVYEVVGNPLVSIIIPSKDHPDILRQCIDSIYEFTRYKNFEIIVVDNGSSEDNRSRIEAYLSACGASYLYGSYDFNFSKMCNLGARRAKGEYLLFLNDDIELFQPEWLERMLGQASQKHVGAVGAKLFYPESTIIQHDGVENKWSGPAHRFVGCDDESPYYFAWNRIDSDIIAVTAACLMVSAGKFRDIGGFDEKLSVSYNDIKLCFSLHEHGYYNVIRNDVFAFHHESLSRGIDTLDENKLIRLSRERTYLYSEFRDLSGQEPFLNGNLETMSSQLALKVYFDGLEPVRIEKEEEGGLFYVDSVSVADHIRITGWSFLEEMSQVEDLSAEEASTGDSQKRPTENVSVSPSRYLVFRDPYGKTWSAPVLPMERQDVVDCFGGDERYRYAGFECILRKADLRVDLMPYEIGMLTTAKDGRRFVKWGGRTNVVRNPKHWLYILDSHQLEQFEPHTENTNIQWSLDENTHQDGYHKLRGYAYVRGNDHYLYQKSIVLADSEGRAVEFEIHEEERLDVAFTFPHEHFLYYTGFLCYIYDCVLEPGHEYEVIIRLRSQFDESDVRDVRTGQKVRAAKC
ncbi:MAG: glycosyltransferase [Lachnospiraceae bacterium]|nr:glycosyltransferase [Lachnospiraceae bacterium]